MKTFLESAEDSFVAVERYGLTYFNECWWNGDITDYEQFEYCNDFVVSSGDHDDTKIDHCIFLILMHEVSKDANKSMTEGEI